MERGLYVLEGKAVYRLNQDWVEAEVGGYIWLRPIGRQACHAGGPRPVSFPTLQGCEPAQAVFGWIGQVASHQTLKSQHRGYVKPRRLLFLPMRLFAEPCRELPCATGRKWKFLPRLAPEN